MNNKSKNILSAAVMTILGTTGLAMSTSASAVIIDGKYELRILTTPVGTRINTYYGVTETFFMIGNQTRGWNSSFTYGGPPTLAGTNGMTDNNSSINLTNDLSGTYGADGAPGAKGSSVVDSYAGKLTFDIVSNQIGNASSFSVDTVFGTSVGDLAQYMTSAGLGGITGSIGAGDSMNLSMAGRFAAVDGPAGGMVGPWNIDPTNTLVTFTTGTTANPGSGTITGNACTGSAGTYACTLVSGGQTGAGWGTLYGAHYFEVWKLELVRIGDADPVTSAVPIPAATWLFGTGLMGLIGVARRRHPKRT